MRKVLEMEVHDLMVDHFFTNQLLHKDHHGSVPKLDTTTRLLKIHNYATTTAEEKKATATVLLDQSNAFNVVDHGILLSKLKVYNFLELTLKWFESYLCRRSYKLNLA